MKTPSRFFCLLSGLLLLGGTPVFSYAANPPPIQTVALAPDNPWPALFELDLGESVALRVGDKTATVKLIGVKHRTEPDHWIKQNHDHAILTAAEVTVEVNGRRETLLCRAYEMPRTMGDIRLYVETTKLWAETPQLEPIKGVNRAVRFSAIAAGRTWGPGSFVFPIRGYRWRSSTYENTWGSLVPFNFLYYHRGEDLGATPDRLDVIAALSGKITGSPLPAGDGKSNGLIIDAGFGMSVRYGHMNIEHIDPQLVLGATVAAGQPIGRTGSTWNGARNQSDDPHLHLNLLNGDTAVSLFPMLAEAYFRSYDDPMLALAGGYGFVLRGESYPLDGSRSLARPGRKIVSYRWRLHDGRELNGARQSVTFDQPGFFAEELIVRADDGSEERDAIHVRVYEPGIHRKIITGWLHYSPSRDIHPGTDVLFWNRLARTDGPARIDFGDGTEPQLIGKEITHVYRLPGLYTVALSAKGTDEDAALLKVRLRVLPGEPAAKP